MCGYYARGAAAVNKWRTIIRGGVTRYRWWAVALITVLVCLPRFRSPPSPQRPWVPRFPLPASGLRLERPTQGGAFFDVVGRRSAAFGYENRALEAWVYPLKLVDDFELSFRLEGYPLEIAGAEARARSRCAPRRPSSPTRTPAFTVRADPLRARRRAGHRDAARRRERPADDGRSARFRPRLRLMWPAGLMTAERGLGREGARLLHHRGEPSASSAVVGSPGRARPVGHAVPGGAARRAAPVRDRRSRRGHAARRFVPIVIAGSVNGRDEAQGRLRRACSPPRRRSTRRTSRTTARCRSDTLGRRRPTRGSTVVRLGQGRHRQGRGHEPAARDGAPGRLPHLGRERAARLRLVLRPRRALDRARRIHSYGDFAAARTALDFLRKYQRDRRQDPPRDLAERPAHPLVHRLRVPVEQRRRHAALRDRARRPLARHRRPPLPRRSSGRRSSKAWRFTAATDTDGNGLVENTKFGHGWVEGGALYPPHEEIYLQGVWIEACRGLAELADVMRRHGAGGGRARRRADARPRWRRRTGSRIAASTRYATGPGEAGEDARRSRARAARARQARHRAPCAADASSTRTRCCPRCRSGGALLDAERAQSQIDHLGGGAMATDWGARLLSDRASSTTRSPTTTARCGRSSRAGPRWPPTGTAGPHVGYQALMANALLTLPGRARLRDRAALGRLQRALRPVVAPPGLVGGDGRDARSCAACSASRRRRAAARDADASRRSSPRTGTACPSQRAPRATARFDLALARAGGHASRSRDPPRRRDGAVRGSSWPRPSRSTRAFGRRPWTAGAGPTRCAARATCSGRRSSCAPGGRPRGRVPCDEGTDVYPSPAEPAPGAASEGLRILRARRRTTPCGSSSKGARARATR